MKVSNVQKLCKVRKSLEAAYMFMYKALNQNIYTLK